ncbi:hypothetical protein [Novimethylophilus kurashikiensis]|uniref:hypothetical protein n=1 Tax=Novimethylophilus kurashikiensis TaxID=1825523 RepID=UPI000D58D477|nr:hypothetical protein [Novimethylophilus kurashikiensis]
MSDHRRKPLVLAVLLLSACSTMPNGPSVMALPGTGKSFDQFRNDDGLCRAFASDRIGGSSAARNADSSLARSAAAGTAIGAVAGAVAGGGRGGGVGAATGLIVGSAVGLGEADSSAYGSQSRYDNAYVQCMYGYGHRVPVSGRLMTAPYDRATPSVRESTPSYYPPPPPPPGYLPPP